MTRRLLVLWPVVFLSIVGFGIVQFPYPLVAQDLGAAPFWVSFGGAGVFSLFQLVATPIWGRMSDAYGRRPILLWSLVGSLASYVWLAYASDLASIILSRALGGLMSGNLSVAFAYTTDVSEPKDRARGLGIVSSAFGLGFAIGPFVGGIVGTDARGHPSLVMPAIIAVALTAVTLVVSALFLRESLTREHRRPFGERAAAGDAAHAASGRAGGKRPGFAQVSHKGMFFGLLAAVAMLTVGGGTVQSIYVVWGAEVHGFSSAAMAVQFLLLAGGAFVSQLVLVGPMVRRLGERGAAMASVASSAIGLTAMALAPNEPALWAALVVYGLGWGVFTPTITSLVSMLADPRSRGAVMGLYQASSSAARVLGPAISGPLFYGLHPHAPLALGVVLALPTAAILLATPKPAPHETLPPDARPRERV